MTSKRENIQDMYKSYFLEFLYDSYINNKNFEPLNSVKDSLKITIKIFEAVFKKYVVENLQEK